MEEITTRERLLFNVGGGGGIEGSLYGEACMTLPPQLGPVEI